MTAPLSRNDEPEIVLTFINMLVPWDSPLLEDHEWLSQSVEATSTDDPTYGEPLFKLVVSGQCFGKDALAYAMKRRAELKAPVSEKQATPQGWTPVTERLPDLGVSVLGLGWDYNQPDTTRWHMVVQRGEVGFLDSEWWTAEEIPGNVYAPTHWMPLPEAPK